MYHCCCIEFYSLLVSLVQQEDFKLSNAIGGALFPLVLIGALSFFALFVILSSPSTHFVFAGVLLYLANVLYTNCIV